jgi:molybdate transport system substrate-binding protein
MLKHIFIGLAVLGSTFIARAETSLRVAAAADLQPVLPPILKQFEEETGVHVEATYQASAGLTTQILNGAPFDVFLSADMGYPRRLMSAGLADSGENSRPTEPAKYANGTLVLWARKDSKLPAPSLDLLRDPGLRRLAIANPDRAPYGRAAVAVITNLKLYDSLRSKLVTAEDIAQAAQFVDSGNADAGLISLTSALTPRLAASGHYFVMPRDLYPPIEQGAVIISRSAHLSEARKFLQYLLSGAVQAQLAHAGLAPVRK